MDGTLGGFASRLLLELRLTPGAASAEGSGQSSNGEWTLADSPFTVHDLVSQAADEVAFRTDALFGARATNLVEGQAEYCLPDFYKVKGIYRRDADGRLIPLLLYDTAQQFDRITGGRQYQAAAGKPAAVFFSGVNSVSLWPVPVQPAAFSIAIAAVPITVSGTLVFEGFRKPGQFWRYDPDTLEGMPLADGHGCPLPVWAHEAVYRCARYRAAMSDERAWVRANIGAWKAEYDGRGGELGRVEAAAALHHHRTANRVTDLGRYDKRHF